MTSDPRLRVSDADRERAMADLATHYAEGRLDHEEYDERLDAIWTARTRADLAVLFGDLPRLAPTPTPTPPARAPRQRARTRVPLVPVLALVIGLAVLAKAPWLVLVLGLWIILSRRRSCATPTGRRHGPADYRRPRRSHGW
ncbi:DUF1707 SHOCT-like domain-containing protein [Nocardioides zeicaulis]|uniref:DUF1707 domain-containing protein n=1 Tax=Nocardioides zeicaulis TaxID=1776857 RepID=A0ABV6E5U0_9ACTN